MQMVRWLIQAMGGPIQGCISMFVDNQATIKIGSNPVQSGRNLHVHAKYFYVRDLTYDGLCNIMWLRTDLQVADIGCSYKGTANFIRLHELLMNSARVITDGDENVWELS